MRNLQNFFHSGYNLHSSRNFFLQELLFLLFTFLPTFVASLFIYFFYICTTSKVNWQRGFCFFIFFWSELFINDKALANTADHSKKMLIGYLHVFLIIFFFFETGGNLLYKVMLVSAIEQHESAISIPLSTPSWTSLPPFIPSHPSRLSQSTRVSSPCYPATSH